MFLCCVGSIDRHLFFALSIIISFLVLSIDHRLSFLFLLLLLLLPRGEDDDYDFLRLALIIYVLISILPFICGNPCIMYECTCVRAT